MIKNIKILILAIAATTLLGSCKKWLDVQPVDRFTEIQVFENEQGVRAALNGVYLKLGDASLYGNNLTMGALEIFAQRYNIGTQHSRRQTILYNYADAGVQGLLDNIWTNAYVNIVNTNVLLTSLDKYKGNWPMRADSIFKGEALALRAMMHFDLLRMFGPMYSTADSVATSIPYYRAASKIIGPLLPANVVMDSIEADLSKAIAFLSSDPVIASGPLRIIANDPDDFFRNRHQRMNFFAARALQARIYLYRNNKPAALQAATTLITDIGSHFAWVTPAQVLSEKANPDRSFSNELLFGLFVPDMYTTYRNLFAPEVHDNTILAPNDFRLRNVFETNENDYRYNPNWILSNVSSKSYKTFYKYADIIDPAKNYRFLVPMLRKSELYYIAAECETDTDKKLEYLNTVRFNRGLTNLTATANLTTEIEKEYSKEFNGEGQMFFFYKRTNATRMLSAITTTATSYVTVNKAHYVFPLPLSELSFR